MRNAMLVTAAAVVVLLAGCARQEPKSVAPLAPQNCKNDPTCTIQVNPSSGVVPDRVLLSKGHANVVKWQLPHASKWKWGDKAVEFKVSGVFDCPAGQSGPVRTCNKANTVAAGEYEYSLHLVYDPFLVNE